MVDDLIMTQLGMEKNRLALIWRIRLVTEYEMQVWSENRLWYYAAGLYNFTKNKKPSKEEL